VNTPPCQPVGFIGLGLMGRPMSRNLLHAGIPVIATTRTISVRDAAAAEGMTVCDSPAQIAERIGAGIIILMLTNTASVAEVLASLQDRLVAGALVIDMGTSGVEETRAWAQSVRSRGSDWLDAPVSGGQVGATEAKLTIMAGGEPASFARALPVLKAMGTSVIHVGPTCTGQVTKLANQLIVASTIAAVAEGFTLARSAGANLALVRQCLLGGFASSRILELHGRRMIERDFQPGGRATGQLKDVVEASRLAQQLGLKLPLLETNLELWRSMISHGLGDLDHSGLIKLYETGGESPPQL